MIQNNALSRIGKRFQTGSAPMWEEYGDGCGDISVCGVAPGRSSVGAEMQAFCAWDNVGKQAREHSLRPVGTLA